MIKFMIMFKAPDNDDAFENAYNDFLALAERMPHRKRRQVVITLGSPMGTPAYHRILELYYATRDECIESLASPDGQEAGSELSRFPNGVDTLFAEIYEEDN